MNIAECHQACRVLSSSHSFILTDVLHLHRDSYDGSEQIVIRRSISVFDASTMVHFTNEVDTFEEALTSVHEFFKTLTTPDREPIQL